MRKLSKGEKEQLVSKVTDLAIRDVLNLSDYAGIMMICRDACSRRIEEIDAEICKETPTQAGKVQ